MRVHRLLDRLGLDAAVISDPKNVCYFTGFLDTGAITVPTYLLLLRDGEDIMLAGENKAKAASRTFRGEVVTFKNYDLGSRMVARPDLASEPVSPILRKAGRGLRTIGVESWHMPKALLDSVEKAAPDTRLTDLSPHIESMRTVKDADEIEAIKSSCKLVDYAYSVAKSVSVPGRTEVDVYADVQQKVVEKAGGFQYFSGDFTTGRRSIDPGESGAPTSLALKQGDTLILDLWATTKGYWTDTARTFLIGGNPTPKQLQVYNVVERALKAGADKMRPGVTAGDVYRAIRGAIAAAGYGELFTHHGGHGVGLDAWERPYLIPGSKDVLKAGMVLAAEPGVYLKGVAGIRLENNFLVEDDGVVPLSKYPIGW